MEEGYEKNIRTETNLENTWTFYNIMAGGAGVCGQVEKSHLTKTIPITVLLIHGIPEYQSWKGPKKPCSLMPSVHRGGNRPREEKYLALGLCICLTVYSCGYGQPSEGALKGNGYKEMMAAEDMFWVTTVTCEGATVIF